MNDSRYQAELAAARDAATLAACVIMARYEGMSAQSSAPADITTQTDRDSQDVILRRLSEQFAADAYRAEEFTPTALHLTRMGRRIWIIDPIDGTRGFVTKNGEFSVMIALVEDGSPVVGVVAEPAQNRTTFASLHGGCWQTNGTEAPMQVKASQIVDPSALRLIQSHTKPGREASPTVRALRPAKTIETYSAGIKLARVADGSADVYACDYSVMNDWDIAAGHVLVTEAGGLVTNLAGEPRRYGKESPKQYGGLLANNGQLHAFALSALRALIPQTD